MTSYLFIKHLHVSLAVLTLLSFSLRGYWMARQSELLQKKLTRILPHVVDTLLLISAFTLVVMSGQYPFVVGWLTLKLLLLLVYIVLGTFALKRGKTRRQRGYFLLASLATLLTIFALALTKPGF
jgi:uncharacterized membrane protein SirB2